MPELACEACAATWTTGVDDLLLSDYWPATLHFAIIYATDVFFSFEEMKMAAPGLSFQAYLRMQDQRTLRFGRISTDSFIKSFFEWEAVCYEVDIMCKEEPFTCPACSPDMLAVSVDGNRKHYRFKNADRSPEELFVEDSGRQPLPAGDSGLNCSHSQGWTGIKIQPWHFLSRPAHYIISGHYIEVH
ncbi:hypothetical protein NQZ68_008661 [Dissostichus eleginoides]|nr:hypothetical protein NQZ68_008661 [Dissostichus eleginoides]